MAIASGVAKQLRYKAESTFGAAPGASGAQVLRRVESSLALSKDTYQSNEIRTDYQIADFRHGVRRVNGNIKGELSPGTYKDFIAAALRRDFAAVSAIASLTLTIAGSGPYTITRGAGSWLSDGIKVGDVVRISAGSVNASNLNKNILVAALTATVITGIVLNNSAMVAEGPIASCTLSVPGKKTYVPTSGHTDKSFAIEHWHSDISQSELFLGCKAASLDFSLPPTGMAELGMSFMGVDVTTAASQYYTSPTAAGAAGNLAAVNGSIIVGGSEILTVTGLSLKVDGGYSADPVVGSNVMPAVIAGRVQVSGQFTAYFESAALRDYFINETEIALAAALTTDNTAAADFVAFSLPRVKVGSANKSDSEKALVQTFDFTALYNSAGGAGTSSEQSTIVVQDSLA